MITAVHHQLLASAMATKLAHEIDSNNQIGCMLAAGSYYPETCKPEDIGKQFVTIEKSICLQMFKQEVIIIIMH